MPEGEKMPDRRQIIEDTYIKPIRSVIAVDDEFPTMDSVLDSLSTKDDDEYWKRLSTDQINIGRLKSIFDTCRARKWMIDVHNGAVGDEAPDKAIDIAHLHQTDLMILDYELSKLDPKHENAHKIIKGLAKNPHFNMVIIYSNEEPRQIFSDILPIVLRPTRALLGTHDQEIEDFWKRTQDEPNKWPQGINDKTCYIECRRLMARSPEDFPFEELIGVGGIHSDNIRLADNLCRESQIASLTSHDIVKWLLLRQQNTISGSAAADFDDALNWKAPGEDDHNWIRSSRLFITIVKKTEDQDIDLVEHLKGALSDWNPSPGRIILSKARAELEENGGIAEDQALSDRWTHAGWLYEVLREEDAALRRIKLSTMLSRQTELLHKKVAETVLGHAGTIINSDLNTYKDAAKVIHAHLHIDLSQNKKSADHMERLFLHYNVYECSQDVAGAHLTTGHVIKFQDSYWLSVTPACDLVPGQSIKKYNWQGMFGHHLVPVKLLRLFEAKETKTALENSTGGLHVFLLIDGKRMCFEITKGASTKSHPTLEQVFVGNQGRFEPDKRLLTVFRPIVNLGGEKPEETKKDPEFCKIEDALVVAQLRYEYALNALHRVGSNLSRVGLDFVSL